jgi:hypothetical protein
MKVLVAVKRVIDFNVRVLVKAAAAGRSGPTPR